MLHGTLSLGFFRLSRLALLAFSAAPAALAALSGVACTNAAASADVPSIRYDGQLGTVPATFEHNVMRVMASLNGSAPRNLVIDTGAAVTAFDTAAYPDVSFTPGKASTVAIQGVTFHDVPAVAIDLCGTSCTDTTIDGIFGANILREHVVSFDYQGLTFGLGPATAPASAEPAEIAIPFSLEGGGTGKIQGSDTVLDVPATRIVINVTIDGVDHPMIVDSGASFVLMRPTIFQSMIADGRKTLAVTDETVTGTAQGQAARTRTVTLGGATVEGAPMQTVTDTLVDGVAKEVGHPIDGLVGGSFLREFFVSIDYPARALRLHRYLAPDVRGDEFRRVGIDLAISGTRYLVRRTFAGTDAAARVPTTMIGAAVVSIDGQSPDGLDDEQADRLLRGAVGDQRTITYATSGATQSITLKVDDIIALP